MKHRHIRTTHEEERTREGGAFVVRGNFARCNDLIWILGGCRTLGSALLGACESAASTTAADFIVQRRSVAAMLTRSTLTFSLAHSQEVDHYCPVARKKRELELGAAAACNTFVSTVEQIEDDGIG